MTYTFHPRSTWEDPRLPIKQSGQANVLWPVVKYGTAHYTADPDVPDGDVSESANDLPGYLRAMQASYMKTRGYSLGYNFAVDWLGGVWEIRGFDIRCAANGTTTTNIDGIAVLFLTDGAARPTNEAITAARSVFTEVQRRCRQARNAPLFSLVVNGHYNLKATACPGAGIKAVINEGLLKPDKVAAPIPPTPPDKPVPPYVPQQEVASLLYIFIHIIGDPAGTMFAGWGRRVKRADGNEIWQIPIMHHLSPNEYSSQNEFSLTIPLSKADLKGAALQGPIPTGYVATDFANSGL